MGNPIRAHAACLISRNALSTQQPLAVQIWRAASESDPIVCANCTHNVAFGSQLVFPLRIILIIIGAKEPPNVD
jgi:hypothetical protein